MGVSCEGKSENLWGKKKFIMAAGRLRLEGRVQPAAGPGLVIPLRTEGNHPR